MGGPVGRDNLWEPLPGTTKGRSKESRFMSITLSCNACGVPFKVGDHRAAQKVKCPRCGTLMQVPFGGVLWGVVMWLLQWQWLDLPPRLAVAGAVAFGLLVGASLGFYVTWKAKKLRLPPWSSYPRRSKRPKNKWAAAAAILVCVGLV